MLARLRHARIIRDSRCVAPAFPPDRRRRLVPFNGLRPRTLDCGFCGFEGEIAASSEGADAAPTGGEDEGRERPSILGAVDTDARD